MLLLTVLYKFLCRHVFLILLDIHISPRVESLDRMETLFNILRDYQDVFAVSAACLIATSSHEGSISPNPHHHLLLPLIRAILASVKRHVIADLTFVSLRANETEYLFIYFLVICIYIFCIMSVQIFSHFIIGFFGQLLFVNFLSLLLSFKNAFYILDTSYFLDI